MILKIKELVHTISESFKLKTKNIYFVIKYLIMSLPLSETENKLTLSSLGACISIYAVIHRHVKCI